MHIQPTYDLDKIKFATDAPTFERTVTGGKLLSDNDKRLLSEPACSGRLGTLGKEELAATKKSITAAMRYIKPYNGPSRTWFAYQNSLNDKLVQKLFKI